MKALVGQELGVSDWLEITQERINTFADVTGDHQWIHVDVARAKAESPFGGPVAHGFLTLSLLAAAVATAGVVPEDAKGAINYGLDNIRFIARIYERPIARTVELVEAFAELGPQLAEPVRFYSSGMRARLAFGLSMAIEFDCFLIDEAMVVGDARFHERCHVELFHKRRDRAFILVSHDAEVIKLYCERASVLLDGRLHNFDSVDQAYDFYQASTT